MSNNYWEDEDEDQDTEYGAPKSEGDLIKQLRKQKRADEKRIKELTEQVDTYSKTQRERIVKEVLEKNGVNVKASRYILTDVNDVTEDSVRNWLRDNGDMFGYKPEATSAVTDEHRQALNAQDNFVQSATSPDIEQDIEKLIDAAQSNEELDKLFGSR